LKKAKEKKFRGRKRGALGKEYFISNNLQW
jgi:hypothetical protein